MSAPRCGSAAQPHLRCQRVLTGTTLLAGMARKPVVLVTGANGEIGHGLIHRLTDLGTFDVLAVDARPLDPELA